MYADFKSLLLNLPIPILLLEDKNVKLSNKETKKLLSLNNECLDELVKERIEQKIFKSCHYMEGIGENNIPEVSLAADD